VSDRSRADSRLRERTRLLARPALDHGQSGTDHLVLTVAEMRLAVPLTALRRTAAPGAVTRLPGLPPELPAVREVGGELLCLADTASLIGSAGSREPAEQHVVVLEDENPLGLLVDEVLDLVGLETSELHPVTPVGAAEPSLLAGVTANGTLVLDIAALLADPRLHLSPGSTDDEGQP
jgi:purine-binding chemotaxis protein CheW